MPHVVAAKNDIEQELNENLEENLQTLGEENHGGAGPHASPTLLSDKWLEVCVPLGHSRVTAAAHPPIHSPQLCFVPARGPAFAHWLLAGFGQQELLHPVRDQRQGTVR